MDLLNYDDVSLFIGLTSCPFNISPYEFYRQQFESQSDGLFANSKRSINKHFKNPYNINDSKDKLLYKPKGYCIFGKFDILLLSLIDDISFSTRSFKPFTQYSNRYFKDIYEHQSYYTLTPSFSDRNNKGYFNFFNNYTKLFSEEFDTKHPFISFTQFKLNPALLIGNGQSYLDIVYSYIETVFEKNEILKDDIHPIVLESLGSHEINILLFSDSIYKNSLIIKEIRELNINTPYCKNKFEKKVNSIKSNSLLATWLNADIDKTSIDNDIFIDTVSCVGHSLTTNINNLVIKDSENIRLQTKWYIKPGHNDATQKCIHNILKKHDEQLAKRVKQFFCIGQADLALELPFDLKLINNLFYSNNKLLAEHVRETYSQVLVDFEYTEVEKNNFFSIKKHLQKNYIISRNEVVEIEHLLRFFNAPSVLVEKILSVCNLFNTLMIEPIFYASFIELFHFIKMNFLYDLINKKRIMENISRGINTDNFIKEEITKPYVIDILKKNVRIIDEAFYNRFFQSHKTNDITDINLDYKGSVRQIISSYDSIFKIFSISFLNSKQSPDNNFDSLVFIADESVVKSYSNSLLINFQHLFQPYIYCSSLIHETCNYYIYKYFRFNVETILKIDPKSEYYLRLDKDIKLNLKYFNKENLVDISFENEGNNVILKDILINSLREYANTLPELVEEIKKEIFIDLIKISIEKNKRLLHYFLVDALTYVSAFHGNIEQYIHWHILYSKEQVNDIYYDVHKIDNNDIFINMFRIAFVLECFSDEINHIENINLYGSQRSIFEHIQNIISNFTIDNDAKEFILLVRDHAKKLYKKLYDIEYLPYDEMSDIKNKIEVFETQIKIGQICNIQENDQLNQTRLETSLYMAAFINVAHEFSNRFNGEKENKKYHKVIRRNTEEDDIENIGQINELEIPNTNDVAYDSLGGFFTTTPKIRKDIHLARTSFYKTTWNFSQIYKKEYFRKF